ITILLIILETVIKTIRKQSLWCDKKKKKRNIFSISDWIEKKERYNNRSSAREKKDADQRK
ncbi:MAG: hypothetical protein ACM67P_03065, partial [Clostridiales bacterium]